MRAEIKVIVARARKVIKQDITMAQEEAGHHMKKGTNTIKRKGAYTKLVTSSNIQRVTNNSMNIIRRTIVRKNMFRKRVAMKSHTINQQRKTWITMPLPIMSRTLKDNI